MIALALAMSLQGPALPAAQADAQASHIFWIASAASADLLSTSFGLKRCPSCFESNPLGSDAEARIALKLGTGAAVGLITWKLERSNHPKWAKIARWTYVGVTAGLVANNMYHGIKRR